MATTRKKRLDTASSKAGSIRKDPRKRPVRGTIDRTSLVNEVPGMSYAFAAPGSRTGTPEHYQHRGWEIVNYTKNGPRLSMGMTGKIGQPVMLDDVVLMTMPTEELKRIEQEGVYGDTGQNMADIIEGKIINGGFEGKDPFRGKQGMRWDGGVPVLENE